MDPGVSRIYSLLAAALRVLPQVTAILLSNYPGEGRLAEIASRIAGFICEQRCEIGLGQRLEEAGNNKNKKLIN